MGEDRGALRALQEVEARCLKQQALIKKMGKFLQRMRADRMLPRDMMDEAKNLEEQAQAAELQG